ncbi:ER membrane protein complex subunit 3-like [Sinocyclocheilus rhinocerous]|uniref:ER membrane protein complex subunit 3-like n=1 Tax=Sinocyclocheilus rhinocerous TaxID=307959 RepID=UPI0007B7A194|nr:PREDICTED: ER membrane protein complex subunit 3-like [Sinocyclocheilus rhinocerous]
MAEPELLLDSNIRLWVVLPIVFITFLVGVIRHYVSILLQSDKKLTLEQVSDSQVLIRNSASWYFLNVFGLRSMYSLILGQDNGADQSRIMQEQMSGAAMAMPADTNKAFKAEWEALELTDHQWALENVEDDLMSKDLDLSGMFSKELPTGIF